MPVSKGEDSEKRSSLPNYWAGKKSEISIVPSVSAAMGWPDSSSSLNIFPARILFIILIVERVELKSPLVCFLF